MIIIFITVVITVFIVAIINIDASHYKVEIVTLMSINVDNELKSDCVYWNEYKFHAVTIRLGPKARAKAKTKDSICQGQWQRRQES